jgi:molybdate transport system permease protein
MATAKITRPAGRSPSGFWLALALLTGGYLAFLAGLLGATASYSNPSALWTALHSPEIRHSIVLSFITCSLTAVLSLLFAVPIGFFLARYPFKMRPWVTACLDIPIVLPPMVIGLMLLIFFQTRAGRWIELLLPLTYTVNGVVLAQWVIGSAFAIRTMHNTFENLSPRPEEVALTLGCSRAQAVWRVTLPAARRGMFAAATVAWARSLGEFGPILVFAGATRNKTEVLPTTVWLELSVGNLEAAVAVSLLLVVFAMSILAALRGAGERI